MSRIHEALKRAEQERAATQGGVTQSGAGPLPSPDNLVSLVEEASGHIHASTPGNGTAAGFSGPSSLEASLARCPQFEWKPDLRSILFMNGSDNVHGMEEYRTLRSRLYHLREKMPLKTLLITSALPKEGKSFTAANLAQVMRRQHGRRVLLIDADLRGPRLHLMLGTALGPGLSDYLQGKSDEFSVIQRGPMDNLFFIPGGAVVDDPGDLVGNGRLNVLIQKVGQLFDWIIVDSPPAVPVSDASLLAKACDGVLMVVRSNSTPADMARRARQEFPDQALVGVVLNAAGQQEAPYTRYYYEAYEKKGTATKP
jgi:protein-tyrosine kinase